MEQGDGKVMDRNYFVLPNNTPFSALECQKAFNSLTEKERLYAHYMTQASIYGSLIVLHQVIDFFFSILRMGEIFGFDRQ